MGAEHTGELRALTEVELATGGDAGQGVEETVLVVVGADPADVGLAATRVDPPDGTRDVGVDAVGLHDGVVGLLQGLRGDRVELGALRHPPVEVLVLGDLRLGVGGEQLAQGRLGTVGDTLLERGAGGGVTDPGEGVGQVAARVLGGDAGLQGDEGLGAVLADQGGGTAGQDGGDVDVAVGAGDGHLRGGGGDELLQSDEVCLTADAGVGAGVLLQGGALGGAGGELRLSTAHALGQVLVLLVLLGHGSKIPSAVLPRGISPQAWAEWSTQL